LTGGLLAELMNLFMSAARADVDMIITFFVAFHVLAVLDKIYLESMCEIDLIEVVEEPLEFKRKA
jgi:hypothetical protein